MRRPQSAKPGHRANWGQGSESDLQDHDGSRGAYRKNVKLMKPDLTTNDFARILPKKIYQDKERLYSQALQLKQNLNETIEQNIRLKTRITILQKQKDKLTKHIEHNRQPQNMKQANSRVNIYPGKSSEKENMMIRNLKKLVRQGKEENQFLKQQNAKIKKAIKYTKINELEIERKMLQDENKRVVTLLEQLNGQLADQDHAQRQLHELRRALQDQQDANRQLNDANLKYMEYIQELQEKNAQEVEKAQGKQNKLQRQLALTKRKLNEATRFVEDLKRELNTLKTQNVNTKSQAGSLKPQSIVTKPDSQRPKLARPVSSNPYKSQGMVGVRLATETKKQQQNKENQKIKHMQLQNQQLKQQLSRTKIKLQQTEREAKRQSEQRSQHPQAQPSKPMAENTNKNNNSQNPKPSVKKIQSKQQQQYYDDNQQQEQNYENEFQPSQHDQSSIASPQKSKPKQAKELDQYKKDFQAQEQQEPLYVKDDEPNKKKKKATQENKKKSQSSKRQPQKDKDSKKKKDKKQYKPDKNLLKQIKELLTYRMKAQRYPYDELKRDIQQAKEKQFSLNDLKGMFINEPFYLTQGYADGLIHYCFENYTPSASQTVSSEVLLTKLRKVIEEFELIDEKEEEDMLLRIAQMVTEYPEELETAFEKIKNGEETVAKQDLIEMFQNLELQHKYIELIIQELSLCSTDTNHLNFVGFFERFYVENMSGLQNGQIDEQQMESSSEEVSRNLKNKDTKKLNQVKAEFEDNDDDLMVDDGEKISLGNQDQYNDANIVSDDEPI